MWSSSLDEARYVSLIIFLCSNSSSDKGEKTPNIIFESAPIGNSSSIVVIIWGVIATGRVSEISIQPTMAQKRNRGSFLTLSGRVYLSIRNSIEKKKRSLMFVIDLMEV